MNHSAQKLPCRRGANPFLTLQMMPAAVDCEKRLNLKTAKQQGVSLIELMIALTIGLIITLAITVLFSKISLGFRTSDDGARAMENGNFSLRVLGEDLRMVGFVGLFKDPARIELARADMIASTAADNCGGTGWPFPLDPVSKSVKYVEHIADPGSLACISAGSFDTNSPAIVIRRASGVQAAASDLASTTNAKLYIQSSHSGAIIFMGKDYATQVKAADRHMKVCRYFSATESCPTGKTCTACPGSVDVCRCPASGVGKILLDDGPIFEYIAHVYYIRPCSRPAGAACTGTDDDGRPIPTLVRRQLSNTDPAVFVETPIAEGVERMTLSYGLDANLDGVPDQYKTSPTKEELATALTVRISLLMRTRKLESNYDDTAMTYTLADGTSFNCATAGVSCKHRRYILSDTVQFKNNAIRR